MNDFKREKIYSNIVYNIDTCENTDIETGKKTIDVLYTNKSIELFLAYTISAFYDHVHNQLLTIQNEAFFNDTDASDKEDVYRDIQNEIVYILECLENNVHNFQDTDLNELFYNFDLSLENHFNAMFLIFESYFSMMHKAQKEKNINNDFGNINFDEMHEAFYTIQALIKKLK